MRPSVAIAARTAAALCSAEEKRLKIWRDSLSVSSWAAARLLAALRANEDREMACGARGCIREVVRSEKQSDTAVVWSWGTVTLHRWVRSLP
jgi:hypothetical protein